MNLKYTGVTLVCFIFFMFYSSEKSATFYIYFPTESLSRPQSNMFSQRFAPLNVFLSLGFGFFIFLPDFGSSSVIKDHITFSLLQAIIY